MNIGSNVDNIRLILGLGSNNNPTTGTVWFDDLSIVRINKIPKEEKIIQIESFAEPNENIKASDSNLGGSGGAGTNTQPINDVSN